MKTNLNPILKKRMEKMNLNQETRQLREMTKAMYLKIGVEKKLQIQILRKKMRVLQ